MIESEPAQKAYRKFFDVLLENTVDGESVIFHCTAGKDRTGFGALLALSALGVPLNTIKKDYLLTNITTKDFVDSMVEHARQMVKMKMCCNRFVTFRVSAVNTLTMLLKY